MGWTETPLPAIHPEPVKLPEPIAPSTPPVASTPSLAERRDQLQDMGWASVKAIFLEHELGEYQSKEKAIALILDHEFPSIP